MQKVVLIALLLLPLQANSAVWWAPNGVLIGNICIVPNIGWEVVQPMPVGAYCFSPRFNSWGFIANQ